MLTDRSTVLMNKGILSIGWKLKRSWCLF